jgi:hypothetical protein
MQHTPLTASSLQLYRDDHGRLVLRLPDGTAHAGVLPVRAFPLAAPDDGLSLVGSDGHELSGSTGSMTCRRLRAPGAGVGGA